MAFFAVFYNSTFPRFFRKDPYLRRMKFTSEKPQMSDFTKFLFFELYAEIEILTDRQREITPRTNVPKTPRK